MIAVLLFADVCILMRSKRSVIVAILYAHSLIEAVKVVA